jgi:hypothetical protein
VALKMPKTKLNSRPSQTIQTEFPSKLAPHAVWLPKLPTKKHLRTTCFSARLSTNELFTSLAGRLKLQCFKLLPDIESQFTTLSTPPIKHARDQYTSVSPGSSLLSDDDDLCEIKQEDSPSEPVELDEEIPPYRPFLAGSSGTAMLSRLLKKQVQLMFAGIIRRRVDALSTRGDESILLSRHKRLLKKRLPRLPARRSRRDELQEVDGQGRRPGPINQAPL